MGPRRALSIVCGPTPFHPRYPLLGFRVPFFSWGAAQRKYSAAAQGVRAAAGGTRSGGGYAQRQEVRAAAGGTRSGKGYAQRQYIRSSRHAVRRICFTQCAYNERLVLHLLLW